MPLNRSHATPRLLLAASVTLFIAVRVLLFFPARNYQADAQNRVALSERWAAHPHFITDAREVWVIGPLQMYLAGGGILFAGRDVGARLPSLLLGCLLVVPLIRLSRRTGASLAPALAVAAVSVHALHIQASTTAASEALFATPLLFALDEGLRLAESGRLRHALAAGIALGCAEALRYEGWLYAILVAAVVARALVWTRRAAPARIAAAIFFVLAFAFPLFWMAQNARHLGSPFYTFTEHAGFHRAFAERRIAAWGTVLFRLHALGFWPLSLVLTLSPGVAMAGLWGVVAALRRREMTWARPLLLIVAIPPILLSLRAALLLDFGLITRFSVAVGCVLACFVGLGVEAIRARVPAPPAAPGSPAPAFIALAVATVLMAISLPVGLALRSSGLGDALAERLRPLSPLADLPPAVERAALDLRARVPARRRAGRPVLPVLVDNNDGFGAMAIAFYSGLAAEEMIQVGAPDFRERMARELPGCAVLFDDGQIGKTVGPAEGRTTTSHGANGAVVDHFAGADFVEQAAFLAPPGGERLRCVCRER